MIVYIPQVIKTEQEASELPLGTIIFINRHGDRFAGVKISRNCWRTSFHGKVASDYLDREVVGWTSLRAVDVLDSLVSVVADRSEFHSVDDVRRSLKERK